MINGDFSEGLQGWGIGMPHAPYASKTLEGCLPVSVNCMHFIPGASLSVVHSPKFAITKGKFYRVTFDLKSTVDNAFVYSTVRLAGPSKYNDLMKDPPIFASSTEWKRHSFVFEATDTAANPTINDQGARFDFAATEEVSMWIANLEIAPFDLGVIGPTRSDLLVNITDVDKTMDCPTRLSNPLLCSSYVLFPEATVAVWPISVSPRSGRIVFTQNITLLDSDEDGIANSQDECAHTVKGLAVNGRGCSLTD